MKFREIRHPAVDYLRTVLRERVRRARSGELDRGASAIEWVIIAAIVVGVVAGVAVVITNALNDRAESVGECIEGVDDFQEGC